MAVIYRDRLVGEAKEIADKGIAKQIAMGDTSLIALQQQRAINDALQQQLVQQTNASLEQVQDNIYQAQRAKKAESAMLGLQSDIATLRDTAEVQDIVANELSNIVNQTEQGAIGIAGQQSAINKAEVQTASQSVLDAYADNLIETGVAKQDTGRMVFNGVFGAITGALEGLIGGSIFNSGIKGLLNPNGGIFKKLVSGVAVGGALGYGANKIGNLVNVGNQYYGDGKTLYDNRNVMNSTILGGTLLGGAVSAFNSTNKLANRYAGLLTNTGDIESNLIFSDKRNQLRNILSGVDKRTGLSIKQNLLDDAANTLIKGGEEATKTVGKTLSGTVKKGAGKALKSTSSLLKTNPYLLLVSAGIGAIIGGLSGGLKKKYTLNLEDIKGTDVYEQFTDFGLDVDAIKDIVYNK